MKLDPFPPQSFPCLHGNILPRNEERRAPHAEQKQHCEVWPLRAHTNLQTVVQTHSVTHATAFETPNLARKRVVGPVKAGQLTPSAYLSDEESDSDPHRHKEHKEIQRIIHVHLKPQVVWLNRSLAASRCYMRMVDWLKQESKLLRLGNDGFASDRKCIAYEVQQHS